jgi:hypothetical protein
MIALLNQMMLALLLVQVVFQLVQEQVEYLV